MNGKLGIGFVGVGWMGSVQLKRLLERDDVEVRHVCQPDKPGALRVLDELGLPHSLYTPDYDQVVADKGIDCVWLVSPNRFHGPQSIQALQTGKHVFCEKPCATKYDEYCTQLELARSNPRLMTFVDYILYFDAMEQNLREMVARDEFGAITQIQVNYRHPINIAGDKAWKLSREVMGDAMGMGIIHSLSVIYWIMQSQARPVSVFASAMPAQVRPFEALSIWNIQIHFDNGATGFCFGNIDTSKGYDAYHNLSGTKGGFIFDSQTDHSHKVRLWSEKATDGRWIYPLDAARCEREGVGQLAWPADTSTPDSGDVIHHQTAEAVGHFLDCVKSGRQSPLSFVNAAPITELGWAALVSAELKRPVELPLEPAAAREILARADSAASA